jgi:NADH:ubiquinone oxidoreductase subunit
MTFLSKIFIKLSAQIVGTDEFGNRYYQSRRIRADGRQRRFVVYKGNVEASKVPSDWHGWLHYTESTPPPAAGYPKQSWQKQHLPNLTGTVRAYRPQGHALKGGKRAPATGDYEPWTPN